MSDVFVSYKAEDRRRVQPIVAALESDGLSVWWDARIGGGDEWRRSIEEQLDAAKCVLVVWSKRSAGPDGRFVRDEASRAMERDVYLPVRIDNVRLPLGFGETQVLNLARWNGNREDPRYAMLIESVRAIVSGKPHPAHQHFVDEPVSRRGLIAGGAVAAVAVAGVSGWFLLKPGQARESSIAVLPFANLSGDPKQAYFSDGIAEELRSALSHLAGLSVVGRTSSEAVRDDDAKTAAEKLGVATILTGSVRRSPATIRINAQLIDGRTGLERWSDNYDRAPGDSLRIQADIAERVAGALSIALGSAAKAAVAVAVGGTHNPAAQDLVFKANDVLQSDDARSYRRALELLDAAIALDSNYARAYVDKAFTRLDLANGFARNSTETAQGRDEALQAARTAIRIAPDLAIAHSALAKVYRSNLRIGESLAEYKRAFALGSGDLHIIRDYATLLIRLGNATEALRLADQALALDRLAAYSYYIRGSMLFYAHRYADAVALANELKRHSPKLFTFRLALGDCLLMLGKTDEALRAYRQLPADSPFRLTGEAFVSARTGNRNEAMRLVQRMKQLYADTPSYQYGQIHAQLGKPDRAFSHLEHAWAIKDGGLLWIRVDPWLDPLRSDPRFLVLEKKLNFPVV